MLGLSMAPATGKLIAEMVNGEPPHIAPDPYSPDRF
jgi:D-amino-acid dehydrogenase